MQAGDWQSRHSDLGYSSYLEWACPALPIFMDSRFELYPTDMWQDYISIANAVSGWETKLAKYGIDVLFLPKTPKTPMASLVTAAKSSPAWRVLYEDADTVIFISKVPDAIHKPVGRKSSRVLRAAQRRVQRQLSPGGLLLGREDTRPVMFLYLR